MEPPKDAAGDTENDVVASLASLHEKAVRTVDELKLREAELAALIPVRENGAAVATFDDRGLLASLTIDPELRSTLDATEVMRDIAIAFANAERPTPTLSARGAEDGQAAEGLIASIFAGLTSGLSAEPITVKNDLDSVTVTTLWGELLSVDADPAWISASSTVAISEEIIRVVNLALRADDPLNRRKG